MHRTTGLTRALALSLAILSVAACDDDGPAGNEPEGLDAARMKVQWGIAGDVPLPRDFQGDDAAEFAFYRPADGGWYVSAGCSYDAEDCPYVGPVLEASDAWPVPADYDGSGDANVALFAPRSTANTTFWRISTADCALPGACPSDDVQWGAFGDVPVPADYDGDGTDEVAIARPGEGYWYVSLDNCGWGSACPVLIEPFGQFGDIPVPADYDGDGAAEMAFYRPLTGAWHISMENCTFDPGCSVLTIQWGVPGAVPVPGDYDGDGDVEPAFFDADGSWHIADVCGVTCTSTVIQWGEGAGEVPVPADYDGDGTTDIAVYRLEGSLGVWYVR